MGQIFCALVLFFVIFYVEALPTHSEDESLCSHDHPLHPYIKLFDVVPEEWKTENDSPDKKPVCFTRIITIETDDNGNELNRFSSYEITFGLPQKYRQLLGSEQPNSEKEFDIYPPFEEKTLTKTNIVNIKCSKNKKSEPNERRNTITTNTPDITTNHDLDFLNDMGEICEDQLDIDIIASLPGDVTPPESDFDNTRRFGGDLIGNVTATTTTTTEPEVNSTTEFTTNAPVQQEQDGPSVLSRMDGAPPDIDVTTEITQIITEILNEMNNSESATSAAITTTLQQDFTFSLVPLEVNELVLRKKILETTTEVPVTTEVTSAKETTKEEPVTEESVTEETVTEETVTSEAEVRRSEENLEPFLVQVKNIFSQNLKPKCFFIDSTIKSGKCTQPLLPIRILTESTLPKRVKQVFVKNLEEHQKTDEMIVSGKNNCYLLKYLTNTANCPSNVEETATLLVIDDLPEKEDDKQYFSISLNGRCTVISKNVDVIECPAYQDALPHIQTDYLPDHVRFKHFPGQVDVHVDNIVVHSFSHCLLLRTMHDIKCKKPDLVLLEDESREGNTDEIRSTDAIPDDEDSIPTFRLGDYSFEKLLSSDENTHEYDNVHLTTSCDDDEDYRRKTETINRTTRTLSNPTTPPTSVSNRRIKGEEVKKEKKARRTFTPDVTTITTPITTKPPPTTITPTTISEVKIPNSRKLSNLLKTIIAESVTEAMPRSSDLFKPDFIVKIACAEQISQEPSCFFVSKYIMQPSFDVNQEFKAIIDRDLLPSDAKIVSAPNLNIFGSNETIYALSGSEKFVLIKKEKVDCPSKDEGFFFILDTGSCASERRDENFGIKPSIVKYKKGNRVYCFDFDENLKLHLIKCPEDLSLIPVLSRPEDLKSLCRSQLKNKNQHEQMNLLRRLNIVTDYY